MKKDRMISFKSKSYNRYYFDCYCKNCRSNRPKTYEKPILHRKLRRLGKSFISESLKDLDN